MKGESKVTSIMKLIVILALLTPVLLAQRKASAAQKKPQPVHAKRSVPAQAEATTDPNEGEAMEAPNQRRKRLAPDTPGAVPSPEEYPFSEAVDALQGT